MSALSGGEEVSAVSYPDIQRTQLAPEATHMFKQSA